MQIGGTSPSPSPSPSLSPTAAASCGVVKYPQVKVGSGEPDRDELAAAEVDRKTSHRVREQPAEPSGHGQVLSHIAAPAHAAHTDWRRDWPICRMTAPGTGLGCDAGHRPGLRGPAGRGQQGDLTWTRYSVLPVLPGVSQRAGLGGRSHSTRQGDRSSQASRDAGIDR